jgi:6-phosphogluconate dehydrogenase
MVPASVTGQSVMQLADEFEAGDIIIDGGNSYYRDDIARASALAVKKIHYVDVGTSGGVFGLERGFCLMIGGEEKVVQHLDSIFATIAPGVDMAPRTPGRTGAPSPSEQGYLHCGPNGAGHFVKMVHNGIEYGIMAAYAEGLAVLEKADIGKQKQTSDAETAPLEHPEFDLTALALHKSPQLAEFAGRVSDSGEGRWTVMAAIDESVPAHVITTSLYERFSSRGEADFADKLLSAMRQEFGGHVEKGQP